jgi:hypothetical protein
VVAVHEVTQLLQQAHDHAAHDATLRLQEHARGHGWPSHLVSALRVEHDNGSLQINYPDHLAGEIEDLEYGTPSTGPHAVLRTFNNRMDQHADLNTHLESYLGALF